MPAAIQFQNEHDWDQVRDYCHELASQIRSRIDSLTGLEPICPDSGDWFAQMVSARLPADVDVESLKQKLYEEFRIEVPVIQWQDEKFIRISIQGYNNEEDANVLLNALESLFPHVKNG